MNDLLAIYVVLNVIALFITLLTCVDGGNFSFVNPKVIYDKIKVNWFGAWALAIIFNIILPAIAIPYWIYKIFTVGRN